MSAAVPPRLAQASLAHLRPDLSGQGNRRLVQRRHCLYTVSQRPRQAVVWYRPISEAAQNWMAIQGVDARRVLCAWHEVDPLIDRQEDAINAHGGRPGRWWTGWKSRRKTRL